MLTRWSLILTLGVLTILQSILLLICGNQADVRDEGEQRPARVLEKIQSPPVLPRSQVPAWERNAGESVSRGAEQAEPVKHVVPRRAPGNEARSVTRTSK